MSSGYLIISVRKPDAATFAILEQGGDRLKYDEASLTKVGRRAAVVEVARAAVALWQANYPRYRDASFRIEDVDNISGEVKVIFGVAYPSKQAGPTNKEAVRSHLVKVAHNTSGTPRRTAASLASHLFALLQMGHVPADIGSAFHTLSLSDQTSVCDEVAADLFTPAVAG